MHCGICEAEIETDAVSCGGCGAPASDLASSGTRSECRVCSKPLWSQSEVCVHCDARGYPALRPPLGGKSLGAPE